MEITSLGHRTDLALLRLGGTGIDDHGDHLVVRSPHNPGHWWGNFLLLEQVPLSAQIPYWLDRFAAEFPAAAHVTLGFDGVAGQVDQLAAFADLGFTAEAQTVMTAGAVHPPARVNTSAQYRLLASDDDWSQSIALRVSTNDIEDPDTHRTFATAKAATHRALVAAGHGGWFGAFVDGRLVAQLGLFTAGPGLARFQAVETHPDFRRQGLAGSLVQHAAQFGFATLGARTLVMVADPDYFAIDLYRSVGFAATETQLQVERAPGGPGASAAASASSSELQPD